MCTSTPALCLKLLRDCLLGCYKPADKVNHFKRFAFLWNHALAARNSQAAPSADGVDAGGEAVLLCRSQLAVGLFPLLDALNDPTVSVRLVAKSCMYEALSIAVNHVLNPILGDILLHASTARNANFAYVKPYDTGKALYTWEKMASLVNCPAL
eukprot:SAG22_NODE_10093_length_553_cov_1.215859_1_plen_153_part_01